MTIHLYNSLELDWIFFTIKESLQIRVDLIQSVDYHEHANYWSYCDCTYLLYGTVLASREFP